MIIGPGTPLICVNASIPPGFRQWYPGRKLTQGALYFCVGFEERQVPCTVDNCGYKALVIRGKPITPKGAYGYCPNRFRPFNPGEETTTAKQKELEDA